MASRRWIYSICSWGHHYPIETYLDLVCRCLRRGGTLIVDLRLWKLDRGKAVLARYFGFVNAIGVLGKKYQRTVWNRA